MFNCFFDTPYRAPALIGLFAGIAVGLILKRASKLRNPSDQGVDDWAGWAIVGVCMLIGATAGLLVQISLSGCGAGSSP